MTPLCLNAARRPPPAFATQNYISPVIFVGPFEHHSNLLPWRESCAEVVTIGESASSSSSAGLDLEELENQLRRFAGRKLKIGVCVCVCVCACFVVCLLFALAARYPVHP